MSEKQAEAFEPIAVVGMACRFPKADSPSEFWANILNKKDCIAEIPDSHWSVEDYYATDPKAPDMTYAKRGGFINQVAFDPMKYSIPPAALEATDTSQLLGMVVAHEALIDAGYGKGREFDRDKVSVVLGVTGALELVIPLGARLGHPIWRKALLEAGIEADHAEKIVEKISAGYVPWQENSFPGLLGNVVAGRIANALDLGGSNCVVDAACASSLSAIHLACLELQTGRCDLALSGGIDTFNDIFMYMCFSKTPALSPSGKASPFDAHGDGTILGEGLGVVALKRLSDAQRDGDHIYAVMKGLGSSSDGKGNAIYAPSAAGQMKALKRTYAQAGIDPRTIEVVEGHGTGTKVGDATEASALANVYGVSEGLPWCALGSVKSQIGHTKAAAGVAGLIKTTLALHRKVIPPTIQVEQPLDVLTQADTPLYVNTLARPWLAPKNHPRRAAVSAFGFGGSNFHCVLEEFGTKKTTVDWDGQVQILAFGGKTRGEIATQLRQWDPSASWLEIERFAAKTRHNFASESPMRLLLLIEEGKPLEKIRENALNLLERYADKSHWDSPEGIVFGSGKIAGKLGILFPGQGSQYVNMLRDLACRFPQFQEVMEELNDVAPDLDDQDQTWRFSDLIYPVPAFADDVRKAQTQRLTRTQIAQPAIGAVSMGALEVARLFGVEPDAVAGHSFGEITALCASGRFNEDAFYMISRLRGRLMAMGSGDKGAMLAVRSEPQMLEDLLREHGLDLVMANKNAPDQTVLSGSSPEIDRAAALLNHKQIRHKRLPVAAAFHSHLVGQAREPFYSELSKLDFPKAKIPVYANATAGIYPDDPQAARQLLANQLLKPVEFVDEIRAMHRDGVRIFLEIGPGARLTGLVKSILKDSEFEALALDASSGKRSGLYDLGRVLAHLGALGYPVNLELWEDGGPSDIPLTGKNKMTVWLSGSNHKSEKTLTRAKKPIPKVAKPIVTSSPQSEVAPKQPKAPRAASSTFAPAQPAVMPRVARPVPKAQVSMSSPKVQDAFLTTQKHMELLQQMQAQTAALHQQFLEGQALAQRNLTALIQQQQQTFLGQPVTASYSAPAPVITPAPHVSHPQPRAIQPAPPKLEQPSAAAPRPQVSEPKPKVASPVVNDAVEKVLLKVLAEKTGYPADMLEMDMQLDADLGVDSIKRVEILSAVQESLPQVTPVAPDELGRLNTLRDIVNVLQIEGASVDNQVASVATRPAVDGGAAKTALLSVIAEKTGYPADMLEPTMSLDADLGIDSIKRVEILSALAEKLPHAHEFKPEEMGELNTLADILAKLGTSATVAQPHGDVVALESALLEVVAEKTGYPTDMLSSDMRLDADLGIDSIKRVEILSALQEKRPELPPVPADEMGRLQSLGDILTLLAASGSAPSVAPQASAPGINGKNILLSIIAEKTGYPEDMLSDQMSLEADLGIDSIKRVEILSSLSEAIPQLPEVQADHVGQFHTIADIVNYLGADAGTSVAPASETDVWPSLLQIVAEKTGYPEDMLEPNMSLEADLGIDSIKRVEILSALQDVHSDLPEVDPETMGQLQTLDEIRQCFGNVSTSVLAPVVTKAKTPVVETSVPKTKPVTPAVCYQTQLKPFELGQSKRPGKDAAVWLTEADSPWGQALTEALETLELKVIPVSNPETGLENLPAPAALILLAPQTANAEFAKQALFLTKAAAKSLQNQPAKTMGLMSISWLGGHFGFGAMADIETVTGAPLAGLVKTAALEWEDVGCRALDLMPLEPAPQRVVKAVQALFCEGPVELGLRDEALVSLELVEVDGTQEASPTLANNDVVLVTGGARGVTAACLQTWAEQQPLRLVLLGRSAAPATEEPAWLASLNNEMEIRKALLNQLEERPTPKQLAAMASDYLRQREIRKNMAALIAAGSEVKYYQADVCDGDAVATVLADVRQHWGEINGLIHGAGVLADKFIVDKTPEQFDRVWETKVQGLETLLQALDSQSLKVLGLFSSSTARFGRVGQVDYAMANEYLNKRGAQWRAQNPACKVMSWNWGPWAGGMVTPDLEKVFAAEGVALIHLQAGADVFVRGLSQATTANEWVVLGGPLQQDAAPVDESTLHTTFEKKFSLEQLPFLAGHAMNDRGVLPMAMVLEWLAHTAITDIPGLQFQGLEQLSIFKALTFAPGESHQVQFLAGQAEKENGVFRVPVAIWSEQSGKTVRHAKAVVLLANSKAEPTQKQLNGPAEIYTKTVEEVYNMLFHRKPFLAIQGVHTYSDEGITATALAAPEPKAWMAKPLRSKWLSDPLMLDAAFQLMVLWCIERYGMPSLPTFLGEYRQFANPAEGETVEVVVAIRKVSHQKVTADMEFVAKQSGALLGTIRGYECIMDSSLSQAFRRNRLPIEVMN